MHAAEGLHPAGLREQRRQRPSPRIFMFLFNLTLLTPRSGAESMRHRLAALCPIAGGEIPDPAAVCRF